MNARMNNQRSSEGTKRSFKRSYDYGHDRCIFVQPRGKQPSGTQDVPSPYSLSSGPADRRIRLLDLQPGNDNDQLQGRLVTVDLNSEPQYYAIICLWGDWYGNNTICLDGRRVLLGAHIWAILKTFRKIHSGVLLWLCAICIDQQDNHEQSSQISLMHTICSSAQAVICWPEILIRSLCLGDHDGGIAFCHSAMNRVFTRRSIIQEPRVSFKGTITYPEVKIHAFTGFTEHSGYRFEGKYGEPWADATARNSSLKSNASNWYMRYWFFHYPRMLRGPHSNGSTNAVVRKQKEQYSKWITKSGLVQQDSTYDDGFDSVREMVELFAGNPTGLDHPPDEVLHHEVTWDLRQKFFGKTEARRTTDSNGKKKSRHGDTIDHVSNAVGTGQVLDIHDPLTSERALDRAWNLNLVRISRSKKEQESPLMKNETTCSADGVLSEAQTVGRLQNQARMSFESVEAREIGHTAIPNFDFEYQRRTTILAEDASQMELLASTWVPTQIHGRSLSTASSACEDMECRSNTTPEPAASEGELSFTGELYSDGESEEDLEGPDERLFIAIEVNRLLQNFRRKQQQETAYFRSCTSPNATSTTSRSSDLLSIPESRSRSSRHVSNLKRPRRMMDDDDEDGEDRGKRPKLVNMLEGRSESALKLFACPYTKYDSNRYSPYNQHEKHYRRCSSVFSTSISRLKQHLYRVHKRPEHYCDRCFSKFSCHQDLANHSRSRLSCHNIESPFDEKMTHDQATLIKRRSRDQDPSDAWFSIYRILFPMSPLPSSPFGEGTISPSARSFGSFLESQIPELRQSFMSEVARRMPSLAERDGPVLTSIFEDCFSSVNFEEYDSSHETSPNTAQDGYLSAQSVLGPSIVLSGPVDEANPRLPEQYAALTPSASEVADANNGSQPASSSDFHLEDISFGDISPECYSFELLDDGEPSIQSRQAMVDEASTNMPIAPTHIDPRDCMYDNSTQR